MILEFLNLMEKGIIQQNYDTGKRKNYELIKIMTGM